jgi:predicted enzyme related to lactoylglutathione lyase
MGPRSAAAHLVIDCNDLDRVSAFWAGLLDLPVTGKEDDWIDLGPLGAGGPVLSFQRVPEAKQLKNRLHLDLAVADFDAATARAGSLGARPYGVVHGEGGSRWQVWRDPESNEFCLCTDPGQ